MLMGKKEVAVVIVKTVVDSFRSKWGSPFPAAGLKGTAAIAAQQLPLKHRLDRFPT